jgi:hypothetical protein
LRPGSWAKPETRFSVVFAMEQVTEGDLDSGHSPYPVEVSGAE